MAILDRIKTQIASAKTNGGRVLNLHDLHLYNEDLDGCLNLIKVMLPNLTTLILSNNYFTSIPDTKILEQLTTLDLGNNKIILIPDSLVGLTNAVNVYLDGNPLSPSTRQSLNNENFVNYTFYPQGAPLNDLFSIPLGEVFEEKFESNSDLITQFESKIKDAVKRIEQLESKVKEYREKEENIEFFYSINNKERYQLLKGDDPVLAQQVENEIFAEEVEASDITRKFIKMQNALFTIKEYNEQRLNQLKKEQKAQIDLTTNHLENIRTKENKITEESPNNHQIKSQNRPK